MENEILITEEILINTIATFMKNNDLSKLAIMINFKENNEIDVDMLGGHKDSLIC